MWCRSGSLTKIGVIVYNNRFFAIHSLLALNNNCRTIQFEPVTKDKILRNHVIRDISVQSQSQCRSNCFQEPNCVSYNYGPLHSDTPTCELSNRTHLQVSSSNFLQKRGYIFQHILVSNITIYHRSTFGSIIQSKIQIFF